jgi:hypothetical protein
MHTVVEDAASWQGAEGKSLLERGFLSEWNMILGFCFLHGGFNLPADVSQDDEKTWDAVVCPVCTEKKTPKKKRECFILGGTLDGTEPLWSEFDEETGVLPCRLHDLKTMKDYAVTKFIFGDADATLHTHAKDDYYRQAQIYRYLAERHAPPEALEKLGVKHLKFTEARLQAFSMGEFPYMGTKYMARKHWRHPFTAEFIPAITFESDAWVEEYITTNAHPIYTSLITGQERAPICPPDGKGEHSWKCDFCAFFHTEFCPNPKVEWAALTAGESSAAAFKKASARHLPILLNPSIPEDAA